jgi:hypothetical protein
METQFSKVLEELQTVRGQLETIQDKGIRAAVTRIVDAVDVKITEAKAQFTGIKDSVVKSFSDAVAATKEKGVSALKGTIDFLKIHSALSFLKGKLGKAVDSLQQGVAQIEKVKKEFHTAKSHAGNAGRLILGKDVKQAKEYDSERGILAGIQRFMNRAAVLLTNTGKVADAAMRKIEDLDKRSEKSSVDKGLKDIKGARADSKLPTPEKKSREGR